MYPSLFVCKDAAVACHPLETISADSPECVHGERCCCQHQRVAYFHNNYLLNAPHFFTHLHSVSLCEYRKTESKAALASIKVSFVTATNGQCTSVYCAGC